LEPLFGRNFLSHWELVRLLNILAD
jgi:hypothetical protein